MLVHVPSDELSERLVASLNATYGVHPGFRAAHAKGVLCAAAFMPTAEAARLSRATHLRDGEVRAHVRFSNGSGDPTASDTTRDARGLAVKFYLPDGTTTDVVAISLPAFFARTPEDLLAFNAARRPDPETGAPDVQRVGSYLAEHPEAVPAVTAAITHPFPASYAALTYNSLHAFGFELDDVARYGRYHFVPEHGDEILSDEEAATRSPDYLREELAARLDLGPVTFRVRVELAAADDRIDDCTAIWPGDRQQVELGQLQVSGLAFDREQEGDVLVFDPTRVTEGIRCSNDPILLARSGAYRASVSRRVTTP